MGWVPVLNPYAAVCLHLVFARFSFVCVLTKRSVRVLLRKLWAKMSEPDWRTVSKAVYLFHTILRDLPREHHDVLRIFLGKVLAFAQGSSHFSSLFFFSFFFLV